MSLRVGLLSFVLHPLFLGGFMKLILSLIILSFCSVLYASEWTIYIHMNADNSLCQFSYKDIGELKSVNAGDEVNIVVAHDCWNKKDSRLIQIKDGQEIVLDSGKEYDMGDWRFFADTAIQVKNAYPAKHFMAIVWNHGGGWKKSIEQQKGVSYDDDSRNHITTPQLGMAMEKIGHIDILGLDACLMQMIEVSYEVADFADYVIASEDSEPGDGWDYARVIDGALNNDLIRSIIDGYVDYFQGKFVTLSAIKTSALKPLVEKIKELVPTIKNIAQRAASSPKWNSEFVDIGYLLPEVKDLYEQAVVYERHTESSTGMSIYVNTWWPDQKYKELKFNKETNWFSLLVSPATSR